MPIATSEYIRPTSAPLAADSSRSAQSMSGLLYRQRAFGHADLARLIADLCFHQHRVLTTVDGVDDWFVALLHHIAPDLAGSGDLTIVGIEFLVQADESSQLQSCRQR